MGLGQLTIIALIGFAILVGIGIGIFVWIWRQSLKKPGDV